MAFGVRGDTFCYSTRKRDLFGACVRLASEATVRIISFVM